MMPESEVMTRMGLSGFEECLDALNELLVSMGYQDAARQLEMRRPGGDDYDF